MKVILIEIANTGSELRYFPLALMSLKAYAKSKTTGHDIEVKSFFDISPRITADFSLGNKVLQYIETTSPDIVGFSCYLWNIQYIACICEAIRRLFPTIKIVLGGPEISANFIKKSIDFVISGEGEESFVGILNYLEGIISIEQIPNATYIRDNQVVSNPIKEMDLSTIVSPFEDAIFDPAYDYMLETTRGCPYSCNYCAWNKSVRYMQEEYVENCLSKLLKEWKVKTLFILDSNFNLNDRQRVRDILKLVKQYNVHHTEIKVEIKVELMDDALIKEFKEAGIQRVDIGIQSTDAQVLERCNRKNDLALIRDRIKKLLTEGFIVQIHLIAGLPDDNFFKSAESLKFVTSINAVRFLAITPFLLLKNSSFYDKKDLALPLDSISSRCVRTNSQTTLDMDRSLLFLRTYQKEHYESQKHPLFEDITKYR